MHLQSDGPVVPASFPHVWTHEIQRQVTTAFRQAPFDRRRGTAVRKKMCFFESFRLWQDGCAGAADYGTLPVRLIPMRAGAVAGIGDHGRGGGGVHAGRRDCGLPRNPARMNHPGDRVSKPAGTGCSVGGRALLRQDRVDRLGEGIDQVAAVFADRHAVVDDCGRALGEFHHERF